MAKRPGELHRGSGIALWRQIAERIRQEFAGLGNGAKIPPEVELATRFGVNRHTVRAALSAMIAEGSLKSEQGRGTFVVRPIRVAYPIARRTRFSAGLEGQVRERRGRMLSASLENAQAEVAEVLSLQAGATLHRVESVGEADGVALSRATSWYDATRFPDFPNVFARTGSVTAAFAELGLQDYVRTWTRIEARQASNEDMTDLNLAPGAVVLVTTSLNASLSGIPVQYSITRFAAERVELRIDHIEDRD